MSKKVDVSNPGKLSQEDLRFAYDRGLISGEVFAEHVKEEKAAVEVPNSDEDAASARADIIEAAEREADVIVSAARAEAQRIIDDANTEAENITQELKARLAETTAPAADGGTAGEHVDYDLEKDLDEWTIPQLQQYLTDKDIEFKKSANKGELIELAEKV